MGSGLGSDGLCPASAGLVLRLFFVGVLTFVGGVLQTKARLCQHEPLQSVHRFSSSSLDAHLRLL